jgi:hypothetical protein
MSAFKVGDRVRRFDKDVTGVAAGTLGRVVAIGYDCVDVDWDTGQQCRYHRNEQYWIGLVAPDVLPVPVPIPVFMSTDSAIRKLMPVASGCLAYFPDALLLVSWISRVGNEKHNPGQPLHWAKEKSQDESDAEVRHMLDGFRGLPPDPGLEPLGSLGHFASKAWRALADLQRACDATRAEYEAGK